MKKINLILVALLAILNFSYGQVKRGPKYDAVVGFSLPEFYTVGCRMQPTKKNQFGIYYGDILRYYEHMYYNSLSIDHQLHFGRVNYNSNRGVYYFRQGITFGLENTPYSSYKHLFGGLSVGRDFIICREIGLSGDFGFFKEIWGSENIRDNTGDRLFTFDIADFFVLPVIRLQLFYSFY